MGTFPGRSRAIRSGAHARPRASSRLELVIFRDGGNRHATFSGRPVPCPRSDGPNVVDEVIKNAGLNH